MSGPLAALFFLRFRGALAWFVLYLVILVITVLFDAIFARNGFDVSRNVRVVFVLMNVAFASLVIFLFAGYFVSRAKT